MAETRYDFKVGEIACTAYLPTTQTRVPILVVCHGWGGNRRLWRLPERIKNKVIKRGMGVVAFDFFGCGESYGDYRDMTYGIWAQNLCDVLDYLKAADFCDASRLGVLGFSSGSTAIFRAAMRCMPAYMISVATCVTPNIGMAEGGPYKALESGAESTVFLGKEVRRGFFADCIDNSPDKYIDKITCETLIMQGGGDNDYRITDARLASRLIEHSKLIIYEGGTHSLDNCATEATNDVLMWFYEHNILTEG